MKKILCLISLATLAACTYDQQPAPYEVYSNDFYGKSGRRSESATGSYVRAKSSPVYSSYSSNNDIAATSDPDEYNRRIDEQNSTRVIARPLGAPPIAKGGEVYSHQLSDNSGIMRRPLAPVAIDGEQQVVSVSSSKTPIHTGGSYNNQLIKEPVHIEESVPPVEGREAFVNPSQLNQERKSSNSLDKIKPVPKPKLNESETAEAEPVKAAPAGNLKTASKAKITPKIQKIETSSGHIDKSTSKMIANTSPNDEEDMSAVDVDAADDEEADEVKPAAKPVAVEAKKSIPDKKEVASVQQPEDTGTEVAEKKPVGKAPGKAIQFIKPVDGQVIAEFGGDKAGGGFNDGISIQAPEGTPVKAADSGTVVYSGNQLQGYGNLIIIRHPNGFLSSYSHLKELELKKGESISQGDIVGHVGKTGNVESPQLQFGIRKGREPVDPKNYL